MSSKIKKWIGTAIYIAAVLTLSAVVLGSFFRVGINGNPPTMFRDMVDGTAHKPFVYRALAPAVIRAVVRSTPFSGQVRIQDAALSDPAADLFRRYGWEPKDATAYAVAAGFLFLCLLLFVHSFGVLTRSQYNLSSGFSQVLSLTALAGLPCFFRYYGYLYDFPHLVIFTYALAMMSLRKWPAYFSLYLLACVSKETAVLLPMVFAVHYRAEWRSTFFRIALVLQVAVFVLVKAALTFVFRDNPGGAVEFHLGHNLTLFPYSFSQFGFFTATALLCAWHWNRKPAFLRNAVWMLLPLLVLTFFFGLLDEYRDYYEVYPIILLLIVPVGQKFLQDLPGMPTVSAG